MSHYFKTLDKYLIRDLQSLNREDCNNAIKMLRKRLKILNNKEYYMSIKIDELPLHYRISNALINKKIETVGQVIEYGWDQLILLRGIGPKAIIELKSLIEKIIIMREQITGLSGFSLHAVLISK